jgi:hypothetical protein
MEIGETGKRAIGLDARRRSAAIPRGRTAQAPHSQNRIQKSLLLALLNLRILIRRLSGIRSYASENLKRILFQRDQLIA